MVLRSDKMRVSWKWHLEHHGPLMALKGGLVLLCPCETMWRWRGRTWRLVP